MLRAWSAAGGVTRTRGCELRPDRVKLAQGAERGNRLHPGSLRSPGGVGCSERDAPRSSPAAGVGIYPSACSARLPSPPPFQTQPRDLFFALPTPSGDISLAAPPQKGRLRPILGVPEEGAASPGAPSRWDTASSPGHLFQSYSRVIPVAVSKRAPAGRRQLGAVALPASVTVAVPLSPQAPPAPGGQESRALPPVKCAGFEAPGIKTGLKTAQAVDF